MVKMFIKHIIFLLSMLLLLFVIFAFPTANAMKINDMYSFCKETRDVDFCLKYIGTDKRILAARDLNDLLLIALSQSKIQVTNAMNQIKRVRHKYSGPIGRERIHICERNYGYASTMFQEAWKIGQEHKVYAYTAHLTALVATDYVRHCEDGWRKNGPIQTSPVTFYNMNVVKLFSIIRTIINKMYRG
ncbi:unnamed protein product [Cochlearia groenlandica]